MDPVLIHECISLRELDGDGAHDDIDLLGLGEVLVEGDFLPVALGLTGVVLHDVLDRLREVPSIDIPNLALRLALNREAPWLVVEQRLLPETVPTGIFLYDLAVFDFLQLP